MIEKGGFDKTGFPVLEGGDVIVLGRRSLSAHPVTGPTGSSELRVPLAEILLEPFGYDVGHVPPEDFLHLDVALSVPRPGLVIVCPDAFCGGIPSCFDGWKRIIVTRDDARTCVNGLPIDQDHYILGYNDHFTGMDLTKALEAEDITVYRIRLGTTNEDGRSIRCRYPIRWNGDFRHNSCPAENYVHALPRS